MNLKTLLASRAAQVTLVMSALFAMNGVALPFLPRWLEQARGLAGVEIGVVLSLPLFARVLIGPSIAFWADGCADRRTPLRVLSLAAAGAYALFLTLPRDFPGLVVFGFAAITLGQGLFPLIEAAMLRATAEGRVPYGFGRGVGSGAFVLANVQGGLVIARFGQDATAVWIVAAFLLCALAAWRALAPDPAPSAALSGARARFDGALALVARPRFLILIFGCGMIQAAHGFYYGFSTLVWRAQGVPAEIVGLLWAFGVIAEILFLWSLPLFEPRTRPELLIVVGGAGAALRWTLLGFAPLGAALWPIQALHALSFAAAHVGAMRLLHREAPEEAQGLAQTMYSALAGGVLIGAATLLSGVLYDAYAARGYWAMAALAAAGAAVAALLFLPAQPIRGPGSRHRRAHRA